MSTGQSRSATARNHGASSLRVVAARSPGRRISSGFHVKFSARQRGEFLQKRLPVLHDLEFCRVIRRPCLRDRTPRLVADCNDSAAGLRCFQRGTIEARAYLLGRHGGSARLPEPPARRVTLSPSRKAPSGVTASASTIRRSPSSWVLHDEIVPFWGPDEAPRNLSPEFPVTRPAQPLRSPAGLGVAGKGGDMPESISPVGQERVASFGGQQEFGARLEL